MEIIFKTLHTEGNGNPLQCSCLENPRDGEAWWAAVYGSHTVGDDWSHLAAEAAAAYYSDGEPGWETNREGRLAFDS